MSPAARTLDLSFSSRALPPGSARFWSHAFAAPAARPALLGLYALSAEWQALSGPATEPSVAQMKLAWWHEEMARLSAGKPLHPVSLYLAELPGAQAPMFEPLLATVQAALLEAGGVPLEHASQLEDHATALLAHPWRVAARLAGSDSAGSDRAGSDSAEISGCTRALAVAEYESHAVRNYRLAARQGRVLFPVDELLAAGIDSAALAAAAPDAALHAYLATVRTRALRGFADAASLRPVGSRYRHLAVLAALGAAHLQRDSNARPRPLKDMLLAWSAARGASS